MINLLGKEESSVTSLQEDTEGGMLPCMGKVKERYYWTNFYKEIKEKVHIASSSHFTLNIARYMVYIRTCSYVAS